MKYEVYYNQYKTMNGKHTDEELTDYDYYDSYTEAVSNAKKLSMQVGQFKDTLKAKDYNIGDNHFVVEAGLYSVILVCLWDDYTSHEIQTKYIREYRKGKMISKFVM